MKLLSLKSFLAALGLLLFISPGVSLADQNTEPKEIRALIIYYSWSNNTRAMAEFIQSQTGFDIEELELVTPYIRDYEELLDQVTEEQKRGYLPPLKPLKADLSSYDVIMIGSPLWIYTLSSPVISFLTNHDLSGKTIVPFCTKGTSSPAELYAKINELCPNSRVLKGFEISRGGFHDAQPQLLEWIKYFLSELPRTTR